MAKLSCAIAGIAGNTFEVWVDEGDSVGRLKKAVEEKMPQLPADQLQLFLAKKEGGKWMTEADVKNNVRVTDDLTPLDDDAEAPLTSVGLSEEDVRFRGTNEHAMTQTTSVHVLVAVAKDAGQDMALIEHSAPRTAMPDRHPERLKRWTAINEMIRQKNLDEHEMMDDEDSIRKRQKVDLDCSVPSSSLSLDDLEPILSMEIFDLQAKTVPDEVVEQLHAQLAQLRQLYGDIYTGNEAKRRMFIAAVLEAVCLLLNDVTILVDEEVTGKNVHVHGRFDFVLKRGKKKIPVVQAKHDRIPEGIAENVAGLEALCDVEGLERTLGIVSNYINWVFISDDDEKIRWIDESLGSSMPSMESLKKVLGKICEMLSTNN